MTQALDRSADEEPVQSVLIGLFWLWTATSIGILAYRIVTTGTVRSGAKKQKPTTPRPDHNDFETRLRDIPEATRAASLGEALTGIQMPVDLAPLTSDAVLDPRHMVFATATAVPSLVGSALADELERLEYSLSPIDERSIRASRADACVEVRIHPETSTAPATLTDRGRVLPDDSVVVEFRLL